MDDHLLALKVMRLTRPSLYATLPVTNDSHDLPGNLFNEEICADLGTPKGLENFSLGNLLMLPQSFGNIYLGETFSCYISVHNDSNQTVRDVSVTADLQTGTQKIPLMCQSGENIVAELMSDSSVDDVIHHEVKEIGSHILVCSVSYTKENGEKLHFRKFFKFQVSKPLDVKTKFYNAESDEVYLEAQLQNITSIPICLERVSLEPSQNFIARQLNMLDNGCSLVFGEVNCLNPLDSRQYLFCLTPRAESEGDKKLLKGVTSIGKLDIVWRSSMGERGRLQTSQLERMAPGYGDIRLVIEEIPSMVTLEKAFLIGCRVWNSCERTMDLVLTLDNKISQGLWWQGISGRGLGKLDPGASVELNLTALPVRTGVQVVSGIRLTDVFLKRMYDYDDIAQVFVNSDEIPT
ncbi:trafficking protein particle complex subunit 13-like isoform X2 [Limulus polyphemus]|uniref:Trafficking protein particle complex subunit 13-like isoform X2 n=1 Tax=Limulus polyphemus TaxID=6850 RepID=A0ABM1BQJ8_LIMPO|nr:trafficking protein particle complex subunit 13-like isoform X2 [Limulus polyphemus]